MSKQIGIPCLALLLSVVLCACIKSGELTETPSAPEPALPEQRESSATQPPAAEPQEASSADESSGAEPAAEAQASTFGAAPNAGYEDDSPADTPVEMTTEAIADSLEQYLRGNLPATAYGGLYQYQSGESIQIVLWAVDVDACKAVADGYTGPLCEIVVQTTTCSLASMQALENRIAQLGSIENGVLHVVVDQQENRVRVDLLQNWDPASEQKLQTMIDESGIAAYVQVQAASVNQNT